MAIRNAEPSLMLFPARNRAELDQHIRDTYGDAVAEELEKTDVKGASLKDQEQVVTNLRDAGLNGQASALLDSYKLHRAEFEKKEMVQSHWYDTVGSVAKKGLGVVKDVALAPFRAVGWAFKNHPFLSTAAVAGILAYLGYAYGIPLAQFAGEGGDERTRDIAETMRNLTRFSPGGDMPGTGRMPIPEPRYPSITPPDVQLPIR